MRFIINKIWQFKLPVALVAIILFAAMVGPSLPVKVQSFLYFLALAFKELLLFVLPLIIFSLILSSIVHLKAGAMRLIFILIPLLLISNFISIWVAYAAGNVILQTTELSLLSETTTRDLAPLWNFTLEPLVSSKYAMVAAMLFGLISATSFPAQGQRISAILNKITAFILNKLVLPFLPLMILGFVIKMQYDDILESLVHNYAYIFFVVGLLQITYVVMLYVVVNKFKTSAWIANLKNMFPPLLTAFSTMASAVTMPLTLIATRKNVHDPDVVNFVIPSTVNFHLIGDCLAMPIFAMAIMMSFGYGLPSIEQYFVFSLYYSVARFSAAAIPGGGALILMPLLASQFNFTDVMQGLIPTLNLMFDPMITAMNVLGNGAFAIIFGKIYHAFKKPDPAMSTL